MPLQGSAQPSHDPALLVVLQGLRKRELELQEMEKSGLRVAAAEQPPQRGSVSALIQEIPAPQTSPQLRQAPGRGDGSGGSWGVAGYRQHSQVTFVRALENALTGWNEKLHFPQNEGILEIPTLCYHRGGCRSRGTSSCAAHFPHSMSVEAAPMD